MRGANIVRGFQKGRKKRNEKKKNPMLESHGPPLSRFWNLCWLAARWSLTSLPWNPSSPFRLAPLHPVHQRTTDCTLQSSNSQVPTTRPAPPPEGTICKLFLFQPSPPFHIN